MKIKESGVGRIIGEIGIKIIKIFLTIYILSMSLIAIDGFIETLPEDKKIAQYAIVYGNAVSVDGTVSPRLQARLEKAIDLFKAKKVEKIIVSGGLGKSGHEEALAMKQYLLNRGIKIPRIIADLDGDTTMSTSLNAFKINKEAGNYPNVGVIGVSQFFHISRVKLSLKKAGFVYIGSASPDYFEFRDIYSILREVPAYIKYFFMGIAESVDLDTRDLKKIGGVVVEKLKDKETYKLHPEE